MFYLLLQVEILKSGLLTNFDGYDPRNFTLEVNEDKPADIRKGVPNHRWLESFFEDSCFSSPLLLLGVLR